MKEIKKIGIMPMAKMQAVLMGIMGLIVGVIYGLMLTIMGLFTLAAGSDEGIFFIPIGIGMLIFMPLMYAAMGFVSGALFSWIYNIAAKKIGGVEIDF